MMKKSATKISGILTLIFAFLGVVISTILLTSIFDITAIIDAVAKVEILSNIVLITRFLLVILPAYIFAYFAKIEDSGLLEKVFTIIFETFSLLMVFWGIKEITISHKSDEGFARCKKTCGFMMAIKCLFFLYLVALIVCSLMIDGIKTLIDILAIFSDFKKFYLIFSISLSVVALILFLLPTINFAVASKKFNNGEVQSDMTDNGNMQYQQPYYQNAPQATMQANMPPMPGYNPQASQQQFVSQPQNINQPQGVMQGQPNFDPNQQAMETQSTIVPGQNGVPENISQKGIADLERLERLKAMGTITEANYNAMRQKICSTNLNG